MRYQVAIELLAIAEIHAWLPQAEKKIKEHFQ